MRGGEAWPSQPLFPGDPRTYHASWSSRGARMGLRYGTPLLRWRQNSSMVSGILTIWSPWSIKDLPKSWRSLGVSLSRL